MFDEIKAKLINKPEYIIDILLAFEFSKIRLTSYEIRCGISDDNNCNSVRIKLNNNPHLFVNDYGRGINCDLISYIIKIKNADFKEVINVIKYTLGITDFYSQRKESVFGGFYDRIKNKNIPEYIKTYDEEILDEYQFVPNQRFINDNIDINTQIHFGIRYDIMSQRIIIPIYDQFGSLIGVKGRANWEISGDEPKYLYLIPCKMSQTLYGYSDNYKYIYNSDIYIFESEKAVMQSFAFGVRNCVSLGSNSLSPYQAKLIAELQPKRVIFMLDKGLDIDVTLRNVKQLVSYTKMQDISICYWDYNKTREVKDKDSPTDNGKNMFLKILNNDIEVLCDV